MTLQHLTGRGSTTPFEDHIAVIDLMAAEDVVLADTEISFCLTELPVEDVLAVLPPALHPSIPGMAAFIHLSVPGGPWGRFDMVLLGVLARSGIKSRLLTTAAFIDGEEAAGPLSRIWGFPLRKAEIKLAVNYDRVTSSVTVDDRVLLEFAVENPVSLTGAGASVRYPQPFNIGRRDGEVTFIQVDASYGFERVARGRPRVGRCDPALIGGLDPCDGFPVAGTLARAKVTLHPLRFVASTAITAEDGGVTLI